MGTYTTNYNLFMPSVGEQGWGDLVNGNFTTIDTTMSGLNARIGTLETEMDVVEDRVTVLEAGEFTYLSPFILKVKFTDTEGAWTMPYSIQSISKTGDKGGDTTTTWTFTPPFSRWLTNANNVLYKLYLDDSVPTVCTITITSYDAYSYNVIFDGVTVASSLQVNRPFTVSNVDLLTSHTLQWVNGGSSPNPTTMSVAFNTGGYITSQL